ncbi:MAG: hypothetical protein U9Q89_05365 [Thermodesulfobacteriota bacterium]|nr:hypothetical protein [Thermodesulfobacteriota bacterium]
MENEWLNITQYDAIRISEYNGKFFIQKARRGEQKNFIEWICPLRYNQEVGGFKPALKADRDYLHVPLQVPLGSEKKRAADTLKALYFQLTGGRITDNEKRREAPPMPSSGKDMPPPMPPEDDVPF